MEKYLKKSHKASNGITLIALVITIIVLLILAGISISMLSGDNSILQKATDAKQTSERAEAKEQAQMDIMAYISDKTANHQDASLDDTKIQEILSDNKSYVKTANATSFITTKGEYEIPYSELYTASDKTPVVPTTGINYGSKTAETIAVGDDITIGTEKFKIIKKSADGKTLTAMPYYNLKLDVTPIKQVTAANAESAGTVAFSSVTSPTWNASENINLDTHENNLKSYIQSYQTTLISLGANNVTTKIGKVHGESTDPDYVRTVDDGLNPSGIGEFWLGSSYERGAAGVYRVLTSRKLQWSK